MFQHQNIGKPSLSTPKKSAKIPTYDFYVLWSIVNRLPIYAIPGLGARSHFIPQHIMQLIYIKVAMLKHNMRSGSLNVYSLRKHHRQSTHSVQFHVKGTTLSHELRFWVRFGCVWRVGFWWLSSRLMVLKSGKMLEC